MGIYCNTFDYSFHIAINALSTYDSAWQFSQFALRLIGQSFICLNSPHDWKPTLPSQRLDSMFPYVSIAFSQFIPRRALLLLCSFCVHNESILQSNRDEYDSCWGAILQQHPCWQCRLIYTISCELFHRTFSLKTSPPLLICYHEDYSVVGWQLEMIWISLHFGMSAPGPTATNSSLTLHPP